MRLPPFRFTSPTTLVATASLTALLVLVAGQRGGRAQNGDGSLSYATSFTVTGNYVVGGVNLAAASAANGVVTGELPMAGVPAGADIVAAFLYWETIARDGVPVPAARFRGEPLSVVHRTSRPIAAPYTGCWPDGTGAPTAITMHRADVRRLLPVQTNPQGTPTGRRLVNSADLAAAGFAPHTVTLPEAGAGQTPHSAGASLVVVYRDAAQPLTKVVLYDGLTVQSPGAVTTHVIRGFLQSAPSPDARVTHIVGSGTPNTTDYVSGAGGRTSTSNPIVDSFGGGTTFDRGWTNPTFAAGEWLPGVDRGTGFGEEYVTSLSHWQSAPYDCLAWAGVVFSTPVRDQDHDGLIDLLEDVSGLKEPDGEPLPDLHAMGAGSDRRDVFVEVNAMHASPGTVYGAARAPFGGRLDLDPANDTVTDQHGHSHMPTPSVLRLVGDTLAAAPGDAHGAPPGIRLHADVGPNYHALGDAYVSAEADAYLVPAALARGGETILETACVEDLGASPPKACLFPDYPGTVGWKVGFQLYRDARIDAQGRRRFDHNRRDLFHYGLYAHAGGVPRSLLACLDDQGMPTAAVAGLESGAPCGAALSVNPLFHVPSSASGRGDLPGGDFMVSLGLWDTEHFVGSTFVQAATTLHELGHNFERWHGGDPPALTPVTVNGQRRLDVAVQPNCKPNYLSVMSYLFQVNGLVDDDGVRHMDFSGSVIAPPIDETALVFGSLPVPLPYRTSWFAPLRPGTLGQALQTRPLTKYCSGQAFPAPLPGDWLTFTRIDAASRSELVDWNADGLVNETPQDVNFDGRQDGVAAGAAPLAGSNDWANLRLTQIGARRTMAGFSGGFLGGYVDGGYVDGGYVDGGYVDGGYVDGGYVDGGYVDGGYVDGGYVDGGYVDGGYVDGGYVDGGIESEPELSFELAAELWGYAPPAELRACVIDGAACVSPTPDPNTGRVRLDWKLPHAGTPSHFLVYRVTGDRVLPTSVLEPLEPAGGVPAQPGQSTYALVDPAEQADGTPVTYLVKAVFPDGADEDDEPETSTPSNYATVVARGTAPVVDLLLTSPPGPTGWFTSAPLTVTGRATDASPVSSLVCTNDGQPAPGVPTGVGTTLAQLVIAITSDGVHDLRCVARDAAGHEGTAGITVRLDATAPTATITSGPSSANPATFTFTGVDTTSGIAGFQCRWDAGAFLPCTSPVAAPALGAGTHTLGVQAIDRAGNLSAIATRSLSVGYLVSPNPIQVTKSVKLGSALALTFQVRTAAGQPVTSTDVVTIIESVYRGSSCTKAPTASIVEVLYQTPNGATGNSSLRFVGPTQSFRFNWDTSTAKTAPIVTGAGCYLVRIRLDDGTIVQTSPIPVVK